MDIYDGNLKEVKTTRLAGGLNKPYKGYYWQGLRPPNGYQPHISTGYP